MLQKFFAINRKVCDKIERHLPHVKTSLEMINLYAKTIAQHVNSQSEQIVVDAGGGARCLFVKYISSAAKAHIIALDASEELLERNTDVEDKRVCNVEQSMPFEAAEADIIASTWLLEHLQRPERFIEHSKRVLKPGGYFIHLLPSKFAPFALVNQALPEYIRQRVLYILYPARKGGREFDAVYDHCYYSGIRRLLERHGFTVTEIHLGYYQSRYFKFFIPLFLLSVVYELLIRSLRMKNLAPYMLIIARKG